MSDVRIRSSAGVVLEVCQNRLLNADDPKAVRDILRSILGQIHLIMDADASCRTIEDYMALQWQWSRQTFGNEYRLEQLITHIRKELDEVERSPDDRFEWIDIALLALDGYNRCGGGTTWSLMNDLLSKQSKNFSRKWVKPEDPKAPIEHDRSNDGPA